MFNQIASFFIGIGTVISSFLGFTPNVGSLTTINGSDKMTDSRAVINANFTDLDTRKLETTATTLPASFLASSLTSVGTLTSGALGTGFTAVPVSLGGTGTTSPTSNYVMLGNGTSGLKTVSGQGTSGQFLTSNGAGQAPTFQTSAVALGDNYAWTGTHSFSQGILATASSTHTATTTISASSVTNNALVLNTVPYKFPSTQGSANSIFINDGSGNLTSTTSSAYIGTTALGSLTEGAYLSASVPTGTNFVYVNALCSSGASTPSTAYTNFMVSPLGMSTINHTFWNVSTNGYGTMSGGLITASTTSSTFGITVVEQGGNQGPSCNPINLYFFR